MWKYLALLLVGTFVLKNEVQAQDADAPIIIKGTLEHAEGKKISLLNVDDNKKLGNEKIKDGTFRFEEEGKDHPTLFALQNSEKDLPLLLILKAGDSVSLEGTFEDFPIAKIQGSKQSEDMMAYQKASYPYLQEAKGLNQRASTLMSNNDMEGITKLQEEARLLSEKMMTEASNFIKKHPNSIASAFVLLNQMQTTAPADLNELYSLLSDEVKDSYYGKSAHYAIQKSLVTAIGSEAPDFTLKDEDGKEVALSSFKGQYVLVDFWAAWCGPCRRENPNLVQTYQDFKDKNFTVLGVSLDQSRDRWLEAIEQDKLMWTQVSDLKGWASEAAALYSITSIPANFLLSPSGKIIAKNLRGEALRMKLQEVLQ